MIDDHFEEIAPGKSRNTMRLGSLTRNYSNAEFTCVGTNTQDNNHAITISQQIKLNRKSFTHQLCTGGSFLPKGIYVAGLTQLAV